MCAYIYQEVFVTYIYVHSYMGRWPQPGQEAVQVGGLRYRRIYAENRHGCGPDPRLCGTSDASKGGSCLMGRQRHDLWRDRADSSSFADWLGNFACVHFRVRSLRARKDGLSSLSPSMKVPTDLPLNSEARK